MSLIFQNPPADADLQAIPESHEVQYRPYPYIFSLDVLRGIAVFAALFISIWVFGGFSANKQIGILASTKDKNHPLFVLISVFLEGKMRAIISLVFGAGIVLFLSKDNKINNVAVPDLFLRKQLWLIALGLINGLLFLNSGDILFHLGIFGIILFPFTKLSFRGLLIAAILLTFIYSAKNIWHYSDERTAYQKYLSVVAVEKKNAEKKSKDSILTTQQKDDKSAWEGILASHKYDPKKDDNNNKNMRSASYAKVWNQVIPVLQNKESQWTYSYGIWDFTALILLGMAVFKAGFFNSQLSGRFYLLMTIVGIIGGLATGWFRLHFNHVAVVDYIKYLGSHSFPSDVLFPFERIFMSLGYCSLVMLLLKVNFLTFVWKAFAAGGRMALTNYLVQSIFLTLFFTGFGMGYFGMLKQYQLYFLAAEVCLVQIVFSVFWLRVYNAGPIEWLLRCLMYGKWTTNKIQPANIRTQSAPALN